MNERTMPEIIIYLRPLNSFLDILHYGEELIYKQNTCVMYEGMNMD